MLITHSPAPATPAAFLFPSQPAAQSYSSQFNMTESNGALEFLGDAVRDGIEEYRRTERKSFRTGAAMIA